MKNALNDNYSAKDLISSGGEGETMGGGERREVGSPGSRHMAARGMRRVTLELFKLLDSPFAGAVWVRLEDLYQDSN